MEPSLLDALNLVAQANRHSPTLAAEIFQLFPSQLQNCRVHFSDQTWYYWFAENYDRLPGNWVFSGTDQGLLVERLHLGLRAFSHYFSKKTLCDFIKRLADPGKHLDMLAELAPLLRISESVEVDYEPSGIGAKPIDYFFKPEKGYPILLDVKFRTKGKVDNFKEMIPHMGTGNSSIEMTPPDPAQLFKDTVEKFHAVSPDSCMQGVWIHPDLKYERQRLEDYFRTLDPQRLHFAILAYWDEKAFVLAHDPNVKRLMISFFNLVPSDSFVVDY